MKYLICILLFIILSLQGCKKDEFNVDCLPTNLQSGVIAFYPFNSGSINDESNHGNDLVNTTNANSTGDRDGNSNCAFEFDNFPVRSEFLTASNSAFLNNMSTFSVAFWYEAIDTSIQGSNLEVLVGRGEGLKCPDRKGEWSIGLYDCRRPVLGHNNSVWLSPITSPYNCLGEIVLLTHNWFHVVAIKNGDSYKLYFNGLLNAEGSGNGGCTNLHLAEDIGDFFIGKDFNGRLDDILIYNRELSANEVDELYNLEPCCK